MRKSLGAVMGNMIAEVERTTWALILTWYHGGRAYSFTHESPELSERYIHGLNEEFAQKIIKSLGKEWTAVLRKNTKVSRRII